MFVIDYDLILQQVRKQSFEYFINTAKDMLSFWVSDACKDEIFTFPVTLISLSFKGVNHEENSLIFSSDSPVLINEEGILKDETFIAIEKRIKEKMTLSYVYCYQAGNKLYILYEDFNGLIDFKINFEEKDHKIYFLSEEIDENPIRFKILEPFFKEDKMQ